MPWIISCTLSLPSLKCFRGAYTLLTFSANHTGLGSKGYLQLSSLVHTTEIKISPGTIYQASNSQFVLKQIFKTNRWLDLGSCFHLLL